MTILVLLSMPPEIPAAGRTRDEFDLYPACQGLAEVLPEAVIEVVRGDVHEILAVLELHRPAVVFNACEAPLGRPDREAHVAAMLEWLAVPFTGNRSETLAICRRKDLTKAVLAAAGIAVPGSGGFPCIVKPLDEDGSVGIDHQSVCVDAPSMERAISRLAGPAIVEDYLPGAEFGVALWGCDRVEHAAIVGRIFNNGTRVLTYRAKWEPDSEDFKDISYVEESSLAPGLRDAILSVARTTWDAVGGHGYMRIDVRLDAGGKPHVIDVNPNPHLGPPGGMHEFVTAAGWSWERFVRQQLAWA